MSAVTGLTLFKALGLPETLYPHLGKPAELRAHLETLTGKDLFELFYYKRNIFPPADFVLIEAALAEKTSALLLDQCWRCYQQAIDGSTLRNSAQADIEKELTTMPHIPFSNLPFIEILRSATSMSIAIIRRVIEKTAKITADIEKIFALNSLPDATTPLNVVEKQKTSTAGTPKPKSYFDTIQEIIYAETQPILERLPLNDLFRAFGQTHGLVKKLATAELEKRLSAEPPFSCYSRQFLYDPRRELNLDFIFSSHLSDLSPAHISDLWAVVPESQDRLSNEFARQLAAITRQKITQFSIDELVNISCQKAAREELETLPADTLKQKLESGPALTHAQYFRRIVGNLQTDSQRLTAVKKLLVHLNSDSVITQEEANAELSSLASTDDRIRKIFAAIAMPQTKS